MPTYDFKCEKCGKVDEYHVALTNYIPKNCSSCKECKLTKVESFSSSKPILKGNGFYETDYKNKL